MTPIHDAIPGLSDVEGYAFEALVETMARHTVAIVPRGDAWLGSGVCVSYKGQAFLATAAHLVKKRALTDVGVIPKAPAPLHVMPRSLLPASIGRTSQGHRCFPQFDRIFVADDDRDIALLSFVDVPTALRDTYFIDLEQNVPSPLEGAVVVLGFPPEIMHTTRGPGTRDRHLFTHVEPTRVITQDLDAIGYNPRYHMVLEFWREGASNMGLRDPRGLSGAGVWSKPSAVGEKALWDPRNVRLAGIQIAWLEKRQFLVATRVEHLVGALEA